MLYYLLAGLGGVVVGAAAAIVLAVRRCAAHRNAAAKALESERQAALLSAREAAAAELERDRQTLADERREVEQLAAKTARRQERQAAQEEALEARDKVLEEKLAACDRREAKLLRREEGIENQVTELDQRTQAIVDQEQGVAARLAEIAGLSREEAAARLLQQLDAEMAVEQSEIIAKKTKETEARAKEIGCEIVSRAIQRYAAEHTAETTTAVVKLSDDDMKGRIIGREGRNIRAFEQATGVDLIIDDTPNQITVSCFDGIRREIARQSLVEVVADGRIQPARIEEVLQKVQQDMDRAVLKLGEDAAFECDVSGLHPQLLRMLGKLHYRSSYGQNVLRHAIEVAHLAGAMASELGLDAKLAKRCGLLHDIGKALDHEHEGSHPELGAEALRRYQEHRLVVNAALAHHEGKESLGIYTTLTAAADAISAARPGARRENVERYLKRLEQLEDIALGYKGVMKAYAIQAGRELRVFINGNTLQDAVLPKVARDIAKRIETEVAYPGEVKVTLIRETRSTAVAR